MENKKRKSPQTRPELQREVATILSTPILGGVKLLPGFQYLIGRKHLNESPFTAMFQGINLDGSYSFKVIGPLDEDQPPYLTDVWPLSEYWTVSLINQRGIFVNNPGTPHGEAVEVHAPSGIDFYIGNDVVFGVRLEGDRIEIRSKGMNIDCLAIIPYASNLVYITQSKP